MSYDLDIFNIKMARADAEAEEEYWKNMEEQDDKKYKQYEENELRKNSKKICKFCKKLGHIVFQMGILTCPVLKQTTCSACGLLGHTPKFCIFLKNSDNAGIRHLVQLHINENTKPSVGANTWVNKVSKNLSIKATTQMVDDCIRSCMQNIARYKTNLVKRL
jgi:hypothetical protein